MYRGMEKGMTKVDVSKKKTKFKENEDDNSILVHLLIVLLRKMVKLWRRS